MQTVWVSFPLKSKRDSVPYHLLWNSVGFCLFVLNWVCAFVLLRKKFRVWWKKHRVSQETVNQPNLNFGLTNLSLMTYKHTIHWTQQKLSWDGGWGGGSESGWPVYFNIKESGFHFRSPKSKWRRGLQHNWGSNKGKQPCLNSHPQSAKITIAFDQHAGNIQKILFYTVKWSVKQDSQTQWHKYTLWCMLRHQIQKYQFWLKYKSRGLGDTPTQWSPGA